jgi:hypothetical protein
MGPKGQAGWNYTYDDIDINLMESIYCKIW